MAMAPWTTAGPATATDPSCRLCDATPALTGLTRPEFDALAARVEVVWSQRRLKALDRPGRLTKVGGGRKFSLPFGSRLFLAVLHLRWGVTYRMLAALFHVGTQTVERACRDLRPVVGATVDRSTGAHHRGSQLLLAELERLGVTDRRSLLDSMGARRCPGCAGAAVPGP